jgi:hypothetical protein
MIFFDSDMSKSTNTVVYFDWKTVINIYVWGKCRTQFMLPMEKSVTFTGACANEITGYTEWITRSFVSKAKKWGHIRIINYSWLILCCFVCLFVFVCFCFVLFCFVLFCFVFCFVLLCFVLFWYLFCFALFCLVLIFVFVCFVLFFVFAYFLANRENVRKVWRYQNAN